MSTLPHSLTVGALCAALLAAAMPATSSAAPKKGAAAAAKEAARQEEIARHLRMATLLLGSGDYAYAAGEARQVIKLDKAHLEARKILASALFRGNDPKALETIEAILKDVPGDVYLHSLRCDVHLKAGDKVEALAALEALALLPGAPPVVRLHAARLLDEKRLAGDASVKQRQREHLVAYLRTPGAANTGDGKAAERMLLDIDHGDVGRQFFDAREAYHRAFQTGGAVSKRYIVEAENGCKRVLQVAPNLQAAHAILGMVYASVKSPGYDLAAAERELRQAPDIAEAWYFLGRILRDSERLPEAAGAFDKALKLQPNHFEAGYQLGVLLKVMNKRDEAIRVFEAVVQANPRSAAASRALAELQAIAPKSQVVARFGGRIGSPADAELFSTERYKAGIAQVEERLLGGVEEGPEAAWLEKMLRRIVDANQLSERVPFRVKVGKTRLVNAFATPHGNIYFTRGFLDHIKKRWPDVALDEHNSYIAGVMAHEITHVVKGHIVNRELFKTALQQGGKAMDPTLFRLTTRLNEIEADREGFLYLLAAGYNPNAMIEWMEAAAIDLGEPPPMEDHPTFDERVTFLADYWTNEVRFAWQAFETGTAALAEAQALEHRDLAAARGQFEIAAQELDRFVRFFRGSKEAWNNLAIAQAKLGVVDLGEASPLSKWYTPLSIEKSLALKLPAVKRKKRGSKDVVFLARARESLQQALTLDPKYSKALVNLAAVHIGLKETAEAEKVLAQAKAAGADAPIVAFLSGVANAEKGNWDGAIAAFEAASKDNDPRALYCLGLARQGKGDKAGAKTAWQAFLDKEDKSSPWAAVAQQSMAQ